MESIAHTWGDGIVDAFAREHPELRDEHSGEVAKQAFMSWWLAGAQKRHAEGPGNWGSIKPLEFPLKGTDGHLRVDTSHVNWYHMACKDVAKAVGSPDKVELRIGGEDPSLLGPGPLGVHSMHGSHVEVVKAGSGEPVPVKDEHITELGPLHVASTVRDDHLNDWCGKVTKAVEDMPEKHRQDPAKVAKVVQGVTPDNFLTGHSNIRTEKVATPAGLSRLIVAHPTNFQDKLHGAVRLGQDIPPKSTASAATASSPVSSKDEPVGHVCKDCKSAERGSGGGSHQGHMCRDCKHEVFQASYKEGDHVCKDCKHEMGIGEESWLPLTEHTPGLRASDYDEHDHRVSMQIHDQPHLGVDVNDPKNTIYVAAKTETELKGAHFGNSYDSRSHGHAGAFSVRTNSPGAKGREDSDIVLRGISSDGKRTPTYTVLFPRKDGQYPAGAVLLHGVHMWRHSTMPNVVMYSPL